jgi:glutamine synthetase
VEVRSVAPDANPYLTMYTLLRTGLEGPLTAGIRAQERYLPDNIYTAIANFSGSALTATQLGAEVRDKFAELKQASADRCPRLLGARIKRAEIMFHHEVTNQFLWSRF